MVEATAQIDVISRHTDRLPSLADQPAMPTINLLNVSKRDVQAEEQFDAFEKMMRGNRGV